MLNLGYLRTIIGPCMLLCMEHKTNRSALPTRTSSIMKKSRRAYRITKWASIIAGIPFLLFWMLIVALYIPPVQRWAVDTACEEFSSSILSTIIDKFKGGPVGLNTIATAMGEDAGTIEDVYEPYLIKEGFIKRTPRGREATELAYKHLGKTPLINGQITLEF